MLAWSTPRLLLCPAQRHWKDDGIMFSSLGWGGKGLFLMLCEGTQVCRSGEGEAALLWGRSELEARAVLPAEMKPPFKWKNSKSPTGTPTSPHHPQGELRGQKQRLKDHRLGAELQGPCNDAADGDEGNTTAHCCCPQCQWAELVPSPHCLTGNCTPCQEKAVL